MLERKVFHHVRTGNSHLEQEDHHLVYPKSSTTTVQYSALVQSFWILKPQKNYNKCVKMVITFFRRFAKGDDLFQSERCGEIDLDNHISARRELPCDTILKQILKALLLPDIVIISPSAAGPSKWPSWVPPVNFSVAEVGSSSDTITYT